MDCSDPLLAFLLAKPLMLVLAGPNGAGKSTFYRSMLAQQGMPFVNADVIAAETGLDSYEAAFRAETVREQYLRDGESFIFETVLSDPVGAKIAFMKTAAEQGFTVALLFIGIASAEQSQVRVNMRVLEGGHDVPSDKIQARYGRTMENLGRAIHRLPHVLVFDNSDMEHPYRKVAQFQGGQPVYLGENRPDWFQRVYPA